MWSTVQQQRLSQFVPVSQCIMCNTYLFSSLYWITLGNIYTEEGTDELQSLSWINSHCSHLLQAEHFMIRFDVSCWESRIFHRTAKNNTLQNYCRLIIITNAYYSIVKLLIEFRRFFLLFVSICSGYLIVLNSSIASNSQQEQKFLFCPPSSMWRLLIVWSSIACMFHKCLCELSLPDCPLPPRLSTVRFSPAASSRVL